MILQILENHDDKRKVKLFISMCKAHIADFDEMEENNVLQERLKKEEKALKRVREDQENALKKVREGQEEKERLQREKAALEEELKRERESHHESRNQKPLKTKTLWQRLGRSCRPRLRPILSTVSIKLKFWSNVKLY